MNLYIVFGKVFLCEKMMKYGVSIVLINNNWFCYIDISGSWFIKLINVYCCLFMEL